MHPGTRLRREDTARRLLSSPPGISRFGAVCLGLLVAAAAGAADAGGSDARDGAIPVGRVTVTATRGARDVLEVPGHTSVLSREQIEQSGARSLEELVRREAGFFVTNSTGSRTGVGIEPRGFSNGGGNGSSLLVLLDGRRLNEADSSTPDWALLNLDEVERIELVRGPASAVWGDNAIGGVIHIVTRRASGPPRAVLRADRGSFETGRASLLASGPLAGPLAGSLFVEGFESDGYRDQSAFRAVDVRASLEAELGEKLALGLRGSFHDDERELPGALDLGEITSFGREASDPDAPGNRSENSLYALDGWLEAVLADAVSFELRPFHEAREDDSRLTIAGFGDFATLTHKVRSGANAVLSVDRPLGRLRSRFVAGADYLYERARRSIVSAGSPSHNHGRRHLLGLFAQEELHLTERLLLSAGVRFDYVDYHLEASAGATGSTRLPDFDVWSPKAALTYRVLPPLSVYASYSRGFRFPTADELLPIVFTGFAATPNVERQRSDAFEVGVKHESERLSGTAALYWMDVNDELIFNPITFANENFDDVRHRGVELALRVRPRPWLELYGSYTFDDVEIRDHQFLDFSLMLVDLSGEHMPITPRHRGTIGARLELPFALELGVNANLVGQRRLANDFEGTAVRLEAHQTVDLHAAWRPRFGEHVEADFSLRVRNVGREEYAGFGALGGAGPVFNTAPRRDVLGSLAITVRR